MDRGFPKNGKTNGEIREGSGFDELEFSSEFG